MLFLVTISSVGASEIDNTEDLSISDEIAIDNGDTLNLNTNDEIIITDDTNEIINEENTVFTNDSDDEEIAFDSGKDKNSVLTDSNSITVTNKTFSGIQTAIDGANDGDTIILDGFYSNDLGNYIVINKPLDFVGMNNAVLDANQLSGILNITKIVTLRNITFQNVYSNGTSTAILTSNVLTVNNCTFLNNYCKSAASTIYSNVESDINIDSCTFINNSGKYGINAKNVNIFNSNLSFSQNSEAVIEITSLYCVNCIFTNNNATYGVIHGSQSIIINSTFKNNTCKGNWGHGGIIYSSANVYNSTFLDNYGLYGNEISNGNFNNCSFVNNSAKSGGAIYLQKGNVVNCSFVNNSATSNGGAIYSLSGSVVNCSFVNNSATNNGGAVNGGSVVNCSFVNNSATNNGGAIYGSGSVVNCSFVNNSATSNGGAIYSDSGSVVNCSFVNNSANYGGAVFSSGSVLNCSFVNNSAIEGGAVYGKNVVNCSFINNHVEQRGGAIATLASASIFNCSFVNNSAGWDGGVIYILSSYTTAQIYDSDFINNSAIYYGGAIYSLDNLIINNCSFMNNSADKCGAINFTKDIKINNCTFENNTANKDPISNPFIKLDGLSFVLGDDGIVVANLSDAAGPLSGKTIKFAVNGNNYTSPTNSDGLAYLNVTSILTELGSYPVTISFAGDEIYSSVSTNATIEVHQYYDPTLILDDLTFFNGDNGYLIANLSDSRGPLANHNLTFNVNGNEINATTNASGLASVNLKDYLSLGTYTANVNFAGDEYDNAASATSTVNVIRDTSILTANDLTVLINNNGNLIANLSDSRGPLANHILSFIIGNDTINQTTNSKGTVTINVKSYLTKAGEYTVRISFAGDDYDTPVSANATVIINKYAPSLTVNNLSVLLDDDCIISAVLSDSRGKLSSKNVTFTVNGYVLTNTTNSQGKVTFNVKDYVQAIGEHTVTVGFVGDDYDYAVSANSTVLVNKFTPTLSVNDLSIYLDDDAILKVNLSNRRGPLSGKTILFTINGTSYPKTTISSGIATFNAKSYLKALGEYNIGVSFEGDEINEPVSTNAIVTVNSYLGTLSVSQIGKYYNDTILRFNLTDNKTNMGISDANIKLVFSNGNTSFISTDTNGIVDFNVPFAPGTYTFNASVIDSNVDVNEIILNNMEIKSRTGTIEVTQNGTGYGNSTLCIRLYNDQTGDAYKNVKVGIDFIDLGVSDEAITNEDGMAVYNIPFNVGTYYVLVSVNEAYTEFASVEKDNVRITKSDSSIVFNGNIGFVLGGSGSTNFTVIGGTVNKANISVIGHPEAIIDLNGNVITVSSLDIGNYTLQVTTTPDSNHNSITSNVNIIVYEASPSSIVFEGDIILDYGGSGSTNFTVIGGTVNVANVSVVDHNEAIILLRNNIVTVSNLSAGNYSLKLITSPYSDYSSSVCYVGITVNKADSSIDFTNDVVYDYGGSGSVNLILNGCTVNQGNISVVDSKGMVHGEAIIKINDARITVSNLSAGNYTLKVITSPDANHNSITETCGITVNRIPSAISFTNITFEYGNTGYTNLVLYGCTVDEENIRVIDSSGNVHAEAIIQLNDDIISVSNLFIGDYYLEITTTPDENHTSVVQNESISVTKVSSSIFFNNVLSFDYGTVGILNLTVIGGSIDSDSLSIQGQATNFEVDRDGENYLVYISDLAAGSYTLKVTVNPDSNHLSTSKYTVFTVKKIDSIIEFNTNKMVYDYGSFGYITIKYADGCSVSVDNVSVIGYSNVIKRMEGKDIIISGLDAGDYSLRIETNPDANHNSVTKILDVTVNKIDSSVSFSNNIVFDYGSSGGTTLNLTGCSVDLNNIKVLGHDEARISYTGYVITVSGLDIGSYTLTVTTTPDANHNSVTVPVSIIVNEGEGGSNGTIVKTDTSISFGSSSIKFAYSGSGSVTVAVSGGTINVKNIQVVGHKEAVIKYSSGKITVSNLTVGKYTLKVTPTADANHIAKPQNITITVTKIPAVITAKRQWQAKRLY